MRLDWLSSELTHVNLNSGVAATIFEALAAADTKLTRSILVEATRSPTNWGSTTRCSIRSWWTWVWNTGESARRRIAMQASLR